MFENKLEEAKKKEEKIGKMNNNMERYDNIQYAIYKRIIFSTSVLNVYYIGSIKLNINKCH